MHYKLIILLSILALIWVFYNFTLFTNITYQNYKEMDEQNNDQISFVLMPTDSQTTIIPFLYKRKIRGAPYSYSISVLWKFDSIRNLRWKIIYWAWSIPLNLSKIEGNSDFYFKSNLKADIPFASQEKLRVVIEFEWEKNNEFISIKKELFLVPSEEIGFWNELIWNIESI